MSVDSFIKKFGGNFIGPLSFYNNTVQLWFDKKDHIYYLVTAEGWEKQAGVTTVCHIIDRSNALMPWAVKMMEQKLLRTVPDVEAILTQEGLEEWIRAGKSAHKEHLEEAGEWGTVAHDWIEKHIKLTIAQASDPTLIEAVDLPEHEKPRNACLAALDWMRKHNVRWLETERKVYSRLYKYAGTMDGLCLCDSCDDPNCCPIPFKDRLSLADWKTSNHLYIEYIYQTAAYKNAYQEELGAEIEDIWVIRLGKDDAEFDPWHLGSEHYQEAFQGFLDCLALYRSVKRTEAFIDEYENRLRGVRKAMKQAAKEEALRIKCAYADKYKGVRKPTCGCQTCEAKYAEVQASKPVKEATEAKPQLKLGDIEDLLKYRNTDVLRPHTY